MNATDAPRPRFSLRRFIVRRLQFIAVAMPLACAVLLLPVDGFIMELLRQFRLWNAVIGLATGVLLLLLRDWKFAGIALLAGLWQGWPVVQYQFFPDGKQNIPEPARLTLLTCNLHYECREPERMIASLQEANPDVLLLLEFTPEWQRKFHDSMWKDYPHRLEAPQPGYAGLCLASRLPLEHAQVFEVAGGVPAVRAVVALANEKITLLGVHPPPPMRPELYETWRQSFEEWPALLGNDGHRVLAGDLNCTPFARTFTAFCERTGLRDSARGFGLRNTWHIAGTPLGLPLDHVLVSKQLLVASRTVGTAPGSDHHWVMVWLGRSP